MVNEVFDLSRDNPGKIALEKLRRNTFSEDIQILFKGVS
jgi:hypothetical protein